MDDDICNGSWSWKPLISFIVECSDTLVPLATYQNDCQTQDYPRRNTGGLHCTAANPAKMIPNTPYLGMLHEATICQDVSICLRCVSSELSYELWTAEHEYEVSICMCSCHVFPHQVLFLRLVRVLLTSHPHDPGSMAFFQKCYIC